MRRVLLRKAISRRVHVINTVKPSFIGSKILMVRGVSSVSLYKNTIHNPGRLYLSRFKVRFYGMPIRLVQPISQSYKDSFKVGGKKSVSRNCTVHASSNGNSMIVDKELMVAIFLEAESGFHDVRGRTMRFSKFLYSRIMLLLPSLSSKSQISIEEIMNYTELTRSDRSKLLDKVSLLFGFSSTKHLAVHVSTSKDSAAGLSQGRQAHNHRNLKAKEVESAVEDFDYTILEDLQKFPSIVLGTSSHLNLYCLAEKIMDMSTTEVSIDMMPVKRKIENLYQNMLEDLERFPSIVLGTSPHVGLYCLAEENNHMDACQSNIEMRNVMETIDNSYSESFEKERKVITCCDTVFNNRSNTVEADKKVHEQLDNSIMEDREVSRSSELVVESESDIHLELSKQVDNSSTMVTSEDEAEKGLDERYNETATGNMKDVSMPINKEMYIKDGAQDFNKKWIPSHGLNLEKDNSICCFLDVPVKQVKVLSSTQQKRLEENGFHTVRKLLQYFPRAYVNIQDPKEEFQDGHILNVTGKILSCKGFKAKAGLGMIAIMVGCKIHTADVDFLGNQDIEDTMNVKTVYLHLKRYLKGLRFVHDYAIKKIESFYHVGDMVSVYGKIKALRKVNHFEIRDFNIKVEETNKVYNITKGPSSLERSEADEKVEILPVYPCKGDCKNEYIAKCIKSVLQCLPPDLEPLPKDICDKFGLINISKAYYYVHSPKDVKQADSGRKRFVFDDFFYLQLGLILQRYNAVNAFANSSSLSKNTTGFEVGQLDMRQWSELSQKAVKALPFSLTAGQLRVSSEILWDLRRPMPMSRLLVGDVGSGKTVVALLAALEVIGSGYQAALMAPTEMLAAQHYKNIVSLLQEIDSTDRPFVALLTGSTPSKDAENIRLGLKNGSISLVVGTHSLTSANVKFKALCLAVIDEQQRFGVKQKESFGSKGFVVPDNAENIRLEDNQLIGNKVFLAQHALMMTATPIPRTLALSLHGDMSLSMMKDLPPGRKRVKTMLLERNADGINEAYKRVEENLAKGGRAFLVYPLIEESSSAPDVLAVNSEIAKVSTRFQGFKCGLVSGQVKPTEREAVIQDFKNGKIQILLATSVIEVGVDIPEATMIVIMNGERFGTSQLHQLRGRVGRGSEEAMCIILSSPCSLGRLKILQHCTNGFELAEADLRHRGAGSLLGTEQSGHLPDFCMARLETDGDVLDEARTAALEIIMKHQGLDSLPKLKAELNTRFPGNASRV